MTWESATLYRFPFPLEAQVQQMAELWGASSASVVRLAVDDFVNDPDRANELLGKRYGALPDGATPAQAEAAQAHLIELEKINHAGLLAACHRPLPYWKRASKAMRCAPLRVIRLPRKSLRRDTVVEVKPQGDYFEQEVGDNNEPVARWKRP